LPAFHAELSRGNEVGEIGLRMRRVIEIGKQDVVDTLGEIQSHQVRLCQRSENCEACAEAEFYHVVDGVGIAHAVGHEGDCLALQGMLKTVSDEAGNVAADMNGMTAD